MAAPCGTIAAALLGTCMPAATNWLAVTNLPVVTNQSFQVTLPSTNRQDFFRLQSP